jgi:hypothetical protein
MADGLSILKPPANVIALLPGTVKGYRLRSSRRYATQFDLKYRLTGLLAN